MSLFNVSLILMIYGQLLSAQVTPLGSTPGYDIAILATQWQPGYCIDKHCNRYTNKFSIHGLWPSNADHSSRGFVFNGGDLTEEELSPIRDRLEMHWPSLSSENFWFWSHEWNKHGKCSGIGRPNHQIDYFTETLNLFESFSSDIFSWFESQGITLKQGRGMHQLEDIRSASSQGFGGRTELQCKNSFGVKILTEIRYCYSAGTLNRIDCPVDRSSYCLRFGSGEIWIPWKGI